MAVFYGLYMAFTFLVFTSINKKTSTFLTMSGAVIALLSQHVLGLGIRSQITTFSFIIFLLYLLFNWGHKPKLLYLLPILFLIWVNMHGGFALGIFIYGLFLINKVIAVFLDKDNPADIKKLIIFFFISILITVINPFGISQYNWYFTHISYPLGSLIVEWVPSGLTTQIAVFILGLIYLTLLFSVKTRFKYFWVLMIISMAIAAIKANRNTPFFWITLFLVVSDVLQKDLEKIETGKLWQNIFYVLVFIGVVTAFLINSQKVWGFINNKNNFCKAGLTNYPCDAVEFISRHPLTGRNIYNTYEWGGYLEWKLPQYQYFVDGRMPVWPTPEGKSPYAVYLEIVQARPGYQKILDKYKTDSLLIGSGTFLDLELQKNTNTLWREIYRDEIAVVYGKSNPH